MSTKQNCKSFRLAVNQMQIRILDRMTEILKKNRRNKEINYLQIQRFKRLIHSWFHFDPVRDLLYLQTVKKFLLYLAAEFLCERKSAIF